MNHDQSIEQQSVAKGLSAPRVTLAEFEANILDVAIVKHVSKSRQVLRWAVITTANGFAVTGKPSVAVSPENDDREICEQVAIENARNELWPLMGYALKEWLAMPKDSAESAAPQRFTFDQFVQYGREHGANIVDGMPWSFHFFGYPVTHETDQLYLIGNFPADRKSVV